MEGQVNMITLCVPSRGRPTLAKRFYDSVMATCSDVKNVEVRFYLNEDDPSLNDYLKNIGKANIWVGPHQSTSFSWNRLALRAKHDIVCLMGDDVQIKTKNWDQKIYEEFENVNDKLLMVVPWTGRPRGYSDSQLELHGRYVCKKNEDLPSPHFAVHKKWIEVLGYMCPPQFWHFYVDTYTQRVSRKIGRCVFRKDIEWRVKKLEDITAKQVRQHLNLRNRDDFVWETCERHIDSDASALKNYIKKNS